MDEDQDIIFQELPPFPPDVPTAPLLRISLAKLLAHDKTEESRLWTACCDLGFFYLDLRSAHGSLSNDQDDSLLRRDSAMQPSSSSPPKSNPKPLTSHPPPPSRATNAQNTSLSGPALLSTAYKTLFPLATDLFSLPLDEKLKYDFHSQGSYMGYKGLGAGVLDSKQTPDANEFWNLAKDDFLRVPGGETFPSPDLLNALNVREEVGSFMLGCHAIVRVVLRVLNAGLGLPDGTLEALHRLEGVSGDQVRFVRAPPDQRNEDDGGKGMEKKLGEHTDFGSVTVLFNQLGGLQVLPPPTAIGNEGQEIRPQWAYVKPLKNHCVVNLGDALVKFTSGILRSNLHRVVGPPGQQAHQTRYSLVYFARPEDAVMLKALEGSEAIEKKRATRVEFKGEEVICAKEWVLRRAMGRRAGGDWEGSKGTEDRGLLGKVVA